MIISLLLLNALMISAFDDAKSLTAHADANAWQHRLLIFALEQPSVEASKALRSELIKWRCELAQRDIQLLMAKSEVVLRWQQTQSHRSLDELKGDWVLLVGKDTGVKYATPKSQFDWPEVRALIDGMPMRQVEMKNDQNCYK